MIILVPPKTRLSFLFRFGEGFTGKGEIEFCN